MATPNPQETINAAVGNIVTIKTSSVALRALEGLNKNKKKKY